MNTKYFKLFLIGILIPFTGCSLDEEYYSSVTPEKFFQSQQSVLQRLNRPFTHARWYIAGTTDIWHMQEFTADAFCTSTKGPHWFDGGFFQRMQHHEWSPGDTKLRNCWGGAMQGIALTLEAQEDLGIYVDYDALRFPEGTRESHLMQLQTLRAYFYMRGLDFFGGLPVYEQTGGEGKVRNTDVETFEHIVSLLTEAIPKLPKKTDLGKSEEGIIHQAAGAMMLAQLYFNANAYIGKEMFTECEKLCQDIINGIYGTYQLDENWYGPFCLTNDRSPEMIWNIPCNNEKLVGYKFIWDDGQHFNAGAYFDIDGRSNNGIHMQPSLKPTGEVYTEFKLGKPFYKFHEKDLRKKPYVYLGEERYEGMFCFGEQTNPITGTQTKGNQEYPGEVIVHVDQVARFSEVGPGKKYASVEELPSTIADGEENSGIRFVKYPMTNLAEKNKRYNNDVPVYRLAETYYMLAECKLRAGNKAEAAELINAVRKRNFEGQADPDPVTAANLDKYRMVDEWLVEFLGEQRRRTDLIRWNMFTTEDWWDHKASVKDHLNRFPIPTSAISSSNLLKQNPGY